MGSAIRQKGFTLQELYIAKRLGWQNKNIWRSGEWVSVPRSALSIRQMIACRHRNDYYPIIKGHCVKLKRGVENQSSEDFLSSLLTIFRTWYWMKLQIFKLIYAEMEIEGKTDEQIRLLLFAEEL